VRSFWGEADDDLLESVRPDIGGGGRNLKILGGEGKQCPEAVSVFRI
jgi:hypothetical protein